MLQQLIDASLAQKQSERATRERSGKFNASQLGRCLRCQICDRANLLQSNPPDARALRVFACGDLFHDFVQSFLPARQCEVKCETDDFIGYADVITEEIIYDIKSVHSKSFWWANKPGYDIKKEKYNNWLQLAYYAWWLKKPKMCLVQISKDDLCINEYVEFTENWRDALQEEMDILRFCWQEYEEQKLLPKADPRTGWEGAYCPYRDYCKGVELETVSEEVLKEHPCHREKK